MSRFSPSDAALEGFRLTRERPLSVLAWAALRFVYSAASLFVLFGIGGSSFHDLMALQADGKTPPPSAVLPLLGQLAPAVLGVLALGLVFHAVFYTAMLRAILRPGDRAFAAIRLSIDELRQFALAVVLVVLFVVYAFIAEVIAIVLIALAKGLGGAALPIDILIVLALIAAVVYPAIRLSVAPAMTFADGRISILRALPVTRGRFWPMFGTYVLAMVLTLVVVILLGVIFALAIGAVGLAQGGMTAATQMFGIMQASDMTLASVLSPLRLVSLGFNAVLSTLGYLILLAPAAAIFRELTGRVGAPATAPKPGQPWG
jgi:hypothetical protein